MRSPILALALLVAGPALAADHDIPWFERNPAARAEILARCRNDYRIGTDPVCGNAEKADQRAYARELAARARVGGLGVNDTPIVREAAQRACARPPSERGLFAQYCRRT